MKLGLFAEHYPPAAGGVATSARRIAQGLTKLGVNVQVFCFDHSKPITTADYLIEETDQEVPVCRIGPFFLKQPSLNLNTLAEKTKATLRRRAFNQVLGLLSDRALDAVMSLYLLEAGYLAQFVAAELAIPHVAGVRGNDIGLNIFHVGRFGVVQWIVNRAQAIVCVNQHLRRRLLLAFPEAGTKTLIIPNSIALPSQPTLDPDTARQRLLALTGWQPADFALTFIGTLREKKGIMTLMTALDQARDLPVRLLVIGPEIGSTDAALCGNLLSQLRKENRVFITGMVERKDVWDWAAAADAIVMPSTDDGLANGLLEGMALGLCPIVSEIFSDLVVNEQNGLVFSSRDASSLKEAFSRLVRDRSIAKRLGQNARLFVSQRHSPMEEFSSYLDLLQNICSKPQVRGSST